MTSQTRRNRIQKTLATAFVVTFGAAAGCSVETAEPQPEPGESGEARGRTGKADLPGSCAESQCGGKGSGLCWCDEKCSDYGDCCFNVIDVCDTANACTQDADCAEGFCGWEEDNQTRVCKPWGQIGDACEGFVMPSYVNKCDPELECVHPEPTHDVPGTCQPGPTVNPPPPPPCDPTLICAQVLTCVDDQLYPTGCGPTNCDLPIGPCGDVDPTCDPTLICAQVLTCVGDETYPTACGPANCDQPLGPCGAVNPPPPPATSCENKCGGPADAQKSCFCDSVCTSFGDCCDDYQAFCL